MEKTPLDKKSPINKSQEPEAAVQAKMDGKQPPQFKLDASSSGGAESSHESVQSEVGSAFGADFSNVNIHEISRKATDVGALAYTQGEDVHFAPGQFQPESKSGKELIGHEFAHVQQQRQGSVQATTEVNGVGVNDDAGLEHSADVAGAQFANNSAVASLGAAAAGAAGGGGGAVQAKEDPLKVDQGQVTFDAEGHDSGRFFSRVCHWPGGASGVTIGRGYDLGHRTGKGVLAHLKSAGITGSQASLLAKGAGLKGSSAGDWVKANKAKVGEINHDQQKLLFEIVYAEHKKDVVRLSTKKDVEAAYGETDFDNLHPAIMEILVDLRYRGDYHSRSRKWIQPIVVKNDLKAFAAAMADSKWKTSYGVPKARFESRKAFMEAAVSGKTPPKAPSKEAPKKGESTPDNNAGSGNTTAIDSGKVLASQLNVRKGPAGSFAKAGSAIKKDTSVQVYEKKDGWLRIGEGQWVSGSYVQLTGLKSEGGTGSGASPDAENATPNDTGVITATALNVRSGPGTGSKVLRAVKGGDKVEIYEKKDGWLRIGSSEWVSGKFVKVTEGVTEKPQPKKETGTVTASKLNVRSGPGGSNKVVSTLDNGESVEILAEKNGWLNIGPDQWVSAKFIKKGEAAPVAKPKPKKETGTVTASTLNVRSDANGSAKVVDKLKNGAPVEILAEKNGWLNIGPDRWVSAKYVNKGGAAPKPAGGTGGSANMPPWISTAMNEVGTKEIVGSKHNQQVVDYHHATSGKFNDDETPWCSSFVNWVMQQSGKPKTNSAMAMSWAKYGKKLDKPALGSIVVFSYGGGKGHVGFVVGKQGSKLQVLGGNQSNMVKISSFSTSKVAAYVVPGDYDVPAANYNLTQGAEVEDSGGLAGTR